MKEQEAITDLNHLYRSYRNCKKGASWKPQVQRFEHDYFLRLCSFRSAMGSTFKHASKETKDNLYGLFTDLFGLYLMEGE